MDQRRGFSSNAGDIPRWTSGRECWVFRAEKPEELCGHHPLLIASALDPGEPLLYLLYSPIFDAKGGPFRVGGAPGSHAVGITPRRLLVSRDPHGGVTPQSVIKVDLAAISTIEIGCALALGWFVVRFPQPQGPGSCSVLFNGQGMPHFQAVVRAYRGLGHAEPVGEDAGLGGSRVWEAVPVFLSTELAPLVDRSDSPLVVLNTRERWTSEKRWWRTRPVCASAAGVLVATARGLLWAASEPRGRPDGSSFGVNLTVVRRDRILDAAIGARGTLPVLRLRAGDRLHPCEMEVPFDGEDVASAEEIVRLTRTWRGQ